MRKISAEIIADSTIHGHRLITYMLTYPRFIHAELMTHRVFSRNSASSRAIPFEKMIKSVGEDPFIPIAWQKDHKGMQGAQYITSPQGIEHCNNLWEVAAEQAVKSAKMIRIMDGEIEYPGTIEEVFSDFEDEDEILITKQLCNRLLEPFLWHTVIVTSTEFSNFFELRCPKYIQHTINKVNTFYSKKDYENKYGKQDISELDWIKSSQSGAEIHIQALAEAMWNAKNESTPKELKEGEWHIPFGDKISGDVTKWFSTIEDQAYWLGKDMTKLFLKVAVARCARLSYMTFDGEIDYKKDIQLHDTLLASKHASPFEHVSRGLTEEEYNTLGKMILDPVKGYVFEKGWADNFRGFISYRRILNF